MGNRPLRNDSQVAVLGRATHLEAGINPYEIMLILNPEVDGSRHDEIVQRVRSLVVGSDGAVAHVDDWGDRKIAYPVDGKKNGRFIVVTCDAKPEALEEINRVLSISKDVVLRSQTIKLSRAQAEIQKEKGAVAPVDDRPDGEPFPRPQRPQRRRSR